LGKSPVITDGDLVLAESGAILEYLAETYSAQATGEAAHLLAAPGSAEHRQLRFWIHYAEGSLMNWLVMKLAFMKIPLQPMPFFARPIARKLCATVITKLIDPNLNSAREYIEGHLAKHTWFAGERLTLADFQMSFAIATLVKLSGTTGQCPHIADWLARVEVRPAYQRGIAKGGPVFMST
jgi:glutathione S-transferase